MKPRAVVAIVVLALILPLPACSHLQNQTPTPGTNGTHYVAGEAQTPDDAILLDRIRLKLASANAGVAPVTPSLPIDVLDDLDVAVANGVVTLRGMVGSYEQKRGLEARVKAVHGVRLVWNELQVMPELSNSNANASR